MQMKSKAFVSQENKYLYSLTMHSRNQSIIESEPYTTIHHTISILFRDALTLIRPPGVRMDPSQFHFDALYI